MEYSKLRSGERVSLLDEVPLPRPFTLYLEPTNVCNFHCSYCPESLSDYYERAGGKFMMSINDFELVAASIETLGAVKTMNFHMMGEPLANQLTPTFIREARHRGLASQLILTTNASLLDERAARLLLDSGLDYLRVSIYGTNQQRFTGVTGSTMPLQRIRDNVERFYRMRNATGQRTPFVYIKMLDPGEDAAQEFYRMFAGTADEVAIEPTMNWNDDAGTVLAGRPKEEMLGSAYMANKKRCCPSPFYTMVIHADLNVSVCGVDWNKKLVIGNLREQSLADIWHGEKLLAIRLAHLDGRRRELSGCKECTYIYTFPDNMDGLTSEVFLSRPNK